MVYLQMLQSIKVWFHKPNKKYEFVSSFDIEIVKIFLNLISGDKFDRVKGSNVIRKRPLKRWGVGS